MLLLPTFWPDLGIDSLDDPVSVAGVGGQVLGAEDGDGFIWITGGIRVIDPPGIDWICFVAFLDDIGDVRFHKRAG